MWAGLGYYSRGQRLLEGAKKVRKLCFTKTLHDSHMTLRIISMVIGSE